MSFHPGERVEGGCLICPQTVRLRPGSARPALCAFVAETLHWSVSGAPLTPPPGVRFCNVAVCPAVEPVKPTSPSQTDARTRPGSGAALCFAKTPLDPVLATFYTPPVAREPLSLKSRKAAFVPFRFGGVSGKEKRHETA